MESHGAMKRDPIAVEEAQPQEEVGRVRSDELFMKLRGILRETYAELGGAEAFHTAERDAWDRDIDLWSETPGPLRLRSDLFSRRNRGDEMAQTEDDT